MMGMRTKNEKRSFGGFTLIEALVFLFIFSIIALAFYQTWTLGMQHIINAKNRLGATAVANERMEIIRSIIFDDIGTTTGIPHGTLAQDEDVTANTTTYRVHTVVQYVDDPNDGTGAAHTDMAPNDYKKVTLTVSWGSGSESERIEMTSIFSLDGVESVAAGTGILSINVLNTSGIGVSGASVHIVNSTVSPAVNITANTDANGNLMFPGAPASVQKYQISVSKGGYYSNATYPPYPTSSYKPVNVDASVVAGSLTTTTLVSDQVSTIAFRTKDMFGGSIPNVDFSISGGLMIGNDATTGAPVYDYSLSTSTDGSGEKEFSDRSTGMYTVHLTSALSGYEFFRLDPESTSPDLINLSPGTDQTVTMLFANKAIGSAIVEVLNQTDGTPIADATVHLTNTTLGYDASATTDTFGKAYFPLNDTPLADGTYDMEVSASGFSDESDSISVSGELVEKSVTMSP